MSLITAKKLAAEVTASRYFSVISEVSADFSSTHWIESKKSRA